MWLNTTQEGLIYPSSRIWEGLTKCAPLSFWLSSLLKIIDIPDIHWNQKQSSLWSFKPRSHPKAYKNEKRCLYISKNASSALSVDLELLKASSKVMSSNKEKFWFQQFYIAKFANSRSIKPNSKPQIRITKKAVRSAMPNNQAPNNRSLASMGPPGQPSGPPPKKLKPNQSKPSSFPSRR